VHVGVVHVMIEIRLLMWVPAPSHISSPRSATATSPPSVHGRAHPTTGYPHHPVRVVGTSHGHPRLQENP
jgi:hypothetical protein